jgi:hypothetical protein
MTAMAPALTTRQLNRATLARQMLLARETTTTVAAVERLAGLQAQLARPPFVGLWTRIEGFQREDLVRPLRERQIIRAAATLVLEPFGKLAKKVLAELEREGDALLRFVEEDAHETGVRVAA